MSILINLIKVNIDFNIIYFFVVYCLNNKMNCVLSRQLENLFYVMQSSKHMY